MIGMETAACPEPDGIKKFRTVCMISMKIALSQIGRWDSGRGQSVYYGVDDVAFLQYDQRRTSDTDHHAGGTSILEAGREVVADLVQTVSHDDSRDDTHDQEDRGDLSEVPAVGLNAPYDYRDTGDQVQKHQLLLDSKAFSSPVLASRIALKSSPYTRLLVGSFLIFSA